MSAKRLDRQSRRLVRVGPRRALGRRVAGVVDLARGGGDQAKSVWPAWPGGGWSRRGGRGRRGPRPRARRAGSTPRCSCGTGRRAVSRSARRASGGTRRYRRRGDEVRLVAVERLVDQERAVLSGVIGELGQRITEMFQRILARRVLAPSPLHRTDDGGRWRSRAGEVDDRPHEVAALASSRPGRSSALCASPPRPGADGGEVAGPRRRGSSAVPPRCTASADGGKISTASRLERRRLRQPAGRSSQKTNGPPRASGTRLMVTADRITRTPPEATCGAATLEGEGFYHGVTETQAARAEQRAGSHA